MVDIRTNRRRPWRLVVLPFGAVALMGLAACGTSTGTSTSAAPSAGAAASASAGAEPTGENGTGSAERAAYRTCLANNGVTLPSRQARPDGAGGAQGDGNGGPPSGAPAAPPDGGAGGQGGAGGGGMHRTPGEAPPGVDATTWAAAQKACAGLAPTPPGGAAPAAGSGS